MKNLEQISRVSLKLLSYLGTNTSSGRFIQLRLSFQHRVTLLRNPLERVNYVLLSYQKAPSEILT